MHEEHHWICKHARVWAPTAWMEISQQLQQRCESQWARMRDTALLTLCALPRWTKFWTDKNVTENALKILKFLLVKTTGCARSLSSANQQCAKRRLFSYVTATADQSAASFEMEMSQTGFSAHYSRVCWPPMNEIHFFFCFISRK